jgi:hypothetical protein
MDQELIAYLDARFGETTEQIQNLRGELEGFREETGQRFDRVETEIRHTQVLVEEARGEVRLVAEAYVGMDERLSAFRKEVTEELEDVKKIIRPVYSTLDQRVRNLEVRKDLQERDPIAIIKERILGLPPK